MSTAELKSHLHQLVVETNDVSVLNKVRAYFSTLRKGKEVDWWDTITAEEKRAIEIGVDQLKKGQGIPHKTVRKKVDALLKRK